MRYLLVLPLVIFLAGCKTRPPSPPAAPATAVGAAADASRLAERQSVADRDSRTLATLQALLARVPDLREEAWRAELGILIARYRDVTPAPAHAAEAADRVAAWADGRVEEARTASGAALSQAQAFADQLAAERVARIAAERREAESRAAAEKAIKQLEADLAKERENFSKSVRKWIVAGLWGLAVVCALLAVLRVKAAIETGLAPLQAAKSAGFLVGLAGTCVSLAKWIGAWWFEYACYAIAGLVVAYVGYLVWREQKGEAATRTLAPVVKTLDALYDDAAGAAKDDLDQTIFARLSEEMKAIPGAKQFIHLIRAGSAGQPNN